MSAITMVIRGFDQVTGLLFEEPEVARYIVIPESAGGISIPDPTFPISDRHIQGFQAPGLIPGSRPVIFFRTRHTGTPKFSVRLNATPLTQHSFTVSGPNSWHEIVPPGALKLYDNELTLSVQGENATVTFSDIVILYRSNQLTVERPMVLSPG
jgi:hypothetical protein